MLIKIDIVEDSAEACDRLKDCIMRYGKEKNIEFAVETYSDPITFLERYRNNADVLFMDIELPHINGMDTVRRGRRVRGGRARFYSQTGVVLFIQR